MRGLDEVFPHKRPAQMAVRNRPDEVAERTAVDQRVVLGVLWLPKRGRNSADFASQSMFFNSVKAYLRRNRSSIASKASGVAHIREVVEDETLPARSAPILGRLARSKVRLGVHIDHGVARGQQHDRVIRGKEFAILAKAAGGALLVVRRPDHVFAADDLTLAAGVRIDARGGKGRGPAAAALVAWPSSSRGRQRCSSSRRRQRSSRLDLPRRHC